jgi:hypothetical protein
MSQDLVTAAIGTLMNVSFSSVIDGLVSAAQEIYQFGIPDTVMPSF